MTIKDPIKTKTTCITVGAVLLALILTFNLLMSLWIIPSYGTIINNFLAGDNVNTSSGSGDVLVDADTVVQSAAEDSMVLLENKDNYLPQTNLTKVNLFGWASTEYGFLLTGAGSGGTSITDDKAEKLDLNDAFLEEGIEYNTELYAAYTAFSTFDADYRSGGSTGADVTQSLLNPDASFYTAELMTSAKEYSSVAVAVLSRWGAENGGSEELVNIGSYKNGTFLELTSQEKAMFDALEEYGFEVIVVLNVCNSMEVGFIDDYSCIKACIFAGIPGQSGTIAIPRIITGEVTPSGKTSDTWAYDYQTNNPSYVNAIKTGSNIAYQEDIYFGYRWYETADAEGVFASVTRGDKTGYDAVVQYPFGYGLSYTSFEWEVTFPSGANLEPNKDYTVQVKVTNVGDCDGKDVVELYGHVDYINGGIEKAERVLLDFAKTKTLKPGESETVTLTYTAYDLASYDDYDKNSNQFYGYEIDGGSQNVTISVQTDAHSFEENMSAEYSVSGNIQFSTDPDTGSTVGNLFTGDDAYADCPTDGSTVYTGSSSFEYLSRKDGFANLSQMTANVGAPSNGSAVTTASNYRYDGYETAEIAEEVSSYSYGSDSGLYLVQVDNDGVLTKANKNQLGGSESDVTLSFYQELVTFLTNKDDENYELYWSVFLNQLTEDDIKLLIGQGGFQTVELESIGKTRCTDKDGPAGFNNNVSNPGQSSVYTLWPSESLLGCSWSKEINYDVGEAQGKIATSYGINGWYGPGVNLHRSVYNSRNYEYYGEDGVLSGKLAAETIRGAKDNNLYCYIKHFALSEEGQNAKNVNTWITEHTLRECYLKPFEIVVKDGYSNAFMSAFNCVGAVLSCYNHALLTDILREEWGFEGTVITDWFEGNGYADDFERGVLAGNDLWLAGTGSKSATLDLSDSAVAYAARKSVRNIIYTYIDTLANSNSLKVNAAAQSPVITILWVGLDVLLGAGVILCVVFCLLVLRQQKSATAEDAPEPETPEDNSDSGTE